MKIIISVSENFLFDSDCNIKTENQNKLVEKISELKKVHNDVIVVTSGSVPMGKSIAKNNFPTHDHSKVFATIGQPYMSLSYSEKLKKHHMYTSNLLLSLDDLYNNKVKIDVFVSTVLQTPNQIPFIYRNYALEKHEQMLNLGGHEYLYRSYSLSIFLYKILFANIMFYIDEDHKILLNQDSCIRTIDYNEGSLTKNAFSNKDAYDLWSNLSILGSDSKYKKPIVITALHENTSFVEMVEDMSEGKYVKDHKTTTIYA